MKKTKSIYLLCMLLGISILGCSKDNISLVKNSYLGLNKSITIGQAFDNYKYFNKVEWRTFQTDNGVTIVEAAGLLNDFENKNDTKPVLLTDIRMFFRFTINHDRTFQLTSAGTSAIKEKTKHVEDIMKEKDMEYIAHLLKSIYENQPMDQNKTYITTMFILIEYR